MAKFNIELDSDSKSLKIMKDGVELTTDGFSISSYECSDEQGNEFTCTCLSYSVDQPDGAQITYSVHFDTGDTGEAKEGKDEYGMAKEITKVHKRTLASYNLGKALIKKK